MMDVETFQKKLVELCALAAGNGNCLNGEQVKDFFTGLDLNKEQLLHIFKYLKIQGITIKGISFAPEQSGGADENGGMAENSNMVQNGKGQTNAAGKAEAGTADGQSTQEDLPLLGETERVYLQEYLDSLETEEFDLAKSERLFKLLAEENGGAEEAACHTDVQEEKSVLHEKTEAKTELTKLYLPVAAQIAASCWNPGIQLADLIQEANVYLLIALDSRETEPKNDGWLRREIRSGLKLVLEEMNQQNFEDECLVARVQNLESAVKDLSEGEDGEESKFSVNELAIILDMEVEEIEDVLRLTGDM